MVYSQTELEYLTELKYLRDLIFSITTPFSGNRMNPIGSNELKEREKRENTFKEYIKTLINNGVKQKDIERVINDREDECLPQTLYQEVLKELEL